MKSKTKIEKQLSRKNNSELVSTIISAKKNDAWVDVARVLSSSRRNKIQLNLGEIDKSSKEGEIIVIPGKVLSQGELNKKIKIVAFSFSQGAVDKITKAKIQSSKIIEEMEKNPSAKGVRILTK